MRFNKEIKEAVRIEITYDDGDTVNLNKEKPLKELSKDELKENYTVKELKKHCKELGIKGYSKLKEVELVEKIYNHFN